mgnify:CR=1 FL=1
MLTFSDALLGLPAPAWFLAITRNSNSVPSFCPVTWNSASVVVATSVHMMLYGSFFSMMYSVTGDPPSSLGAFHFRSRVWAVTLLISGVLGAPGATV